MSSTLAVYYNDLGIYKNCQYLGPKPQTSSFPVWSLKQQHAQDPHPDLLNQNFWWDGTQKTALTSSLGNSAVCSSLGTTSLFFPGHQFLLVILIVQFPTLHLCGTHFLMCITRGALFFVQNSFKTVLTHIIKIASCG